MKDRMLLFSVAAALVFMACGCSLPPAPMNMPRLFVDDGAQYVDARYSQGSKYGFYESEIGQYRGQLPRMDDRDYSMLAANQAMLAMVMGDMEAANQHAMDAQFIMRGKVKGEEGKAAAATLGDEAAKVYKGESYEIGMLNAFIGICQLQLGDEETAAIGFRRALEADKMSKEEFRDDFDLAYWGLGMCFLDSDPSAATQAFAKIGYRPADAVRDDNVVFVLMLGRAPRRELRGLYGSQDRLVLSPYEPRSAKVFVDGVSVGEAVKVLDLYEQSQGVPKTSKDTGQGVKAGTKWMISWLPFGSDLVKLWSVKADSRSCYMLPNEVHVLSASVAPGEHMVNVKFYNAQGRELRRYEQVWHWIPVPPKGKGRRFITIRSEFDRCNVQPPVPFTRISQVSVKRVPAAGGESAGETVEKTEVTFQASNLPGIKVGQTVTLCHFFSQTENRNDLNYDWRYRPMVYDNNGDPKGYPDMDFRIADYDVGIIGTAKITKIQGDRAWAEVQSLTTEYSPRVDDMVTAVRKVGRIWQ